MTLPSNCPRCATARLVTGTSRKPIQFVADSATASELRLGVPADSWLRACSECGLLFGELSTRELNDQLSRFPDARTMHWLSSKPEKPL